MSGGAGEKASNGEKLKGPDRARMRPLFIKGAGNEIRVNYKRN
jgi:hypothetical protein